MGQKQHMNLAVLGRKKNMKQKPDKNKIKMKNTLVGD